MNALPSEHFVCTHCLRYQPYDNICAHCDRVMTHGTLCDCGEHIAAHGADECVHCLADEARADPSALETMGSLRAQVLAVLRASAEPSYEPGFMVRRQAGGES